MGEALIVSRGGGSGGSGGNKHLITEVITETTQWYKPSNIVNNEIHVRLFGAGGHGAGVYDYVTDKNDGWGSKTSSGAGGGGGNMNYAILNISAYNSIPITIGTGTTGNGGTTSFGQLLSATGGERPYINALRGHGGNGGSGGGGLVGWNGGTGFYGGGGGCSTSVDYFGYGGNGGKYGGGGGGYSNASYASNMLVARGGCLYENSENSLEVTGYSGLAGNGGIRNKNAENGINTIGMGLDFEGAGLCGIGNNNVNNYSYVGAGGGGYGGNGGNCYITTGSLWYASTGGGGGYGANGGSGMGVGGSGGAGGGGGGYGGKGGKAFSTAYRNSSGWIYNAHFGGGGGGYGLAGDAAQVLGAAPGYAAGGTAGFNGGNGICILSYYVYDT